MRRRRSSLAVLAVPLALAGCSIGSIDQQWYKPGGNYTSAEFEQDRQACTRKRQLDEDCLRARGWASLSTDVAPSQQAPVVPPSRQRY